jgi:hypothetical protein
MASFKPPKIGDKLVPVFTDHRDPGRPGERSGDGSNFDRPAQAASRNREFAARSVVRRPAAAMIDSAQWDTPQQSAPLRFCSRPTGSTI